MKALFLADTHVHFYPGMSWALLLEGAVRNFAQAEAEMRAEPGVKDLQVVRLLCLTERKDCAAFTELCGEQIPASWPTEWRRVEHAEPAVLLFRHANGDQLAIVAGRQIRTSNGLEVLALGTTAQFQDGLSLENSIETVLAANALTILPWAFGKWLFKRGRAIVEAQRQFGKKLYIADSMLRPRGWPTPSSFKVARLDGQVVLAGTDPLPIIGDEERAGGYISSIIAELDPDNIWRSFRAAIADSQPNIRSYGSRLNLWTMLKLNFQLRLAKQGK